MKLLKEDGKVYIITTPARFDNYYHEHISYFNLKSMLALAKRCELEVTNFKEVSMHGTSYLFELSKPKEEIQPKTDLLKSLDNAVGYGASASGVVLLNNLNLNLEYVVDDNELKQGRFIPGVNTPIYSMNYLANDNRDLTIVVLAHHLFNEID